MNLRLVVRALEARDVTVAMDIGVHQHCTIDSNCPKAIELRRIISASGVTLEQIIEAHAEITAPDPVNYDDMVHAIDGRVNIRIAGQDVPIDLTSLVSEQLRTSLQDRIATVRRIEESVRSFGRSLYASYLTEINKVRQRRDLPQMTYPLEDMIELGCTITADSDHYQVAFEFSYRPEYIVQDGIRFRIADADIARIKRVPAYLMFMITQDRRILRIKLMNASGAKLWHYHGGDRDDCWGNVRLPPQWDGSLESLHRLSISLRSSLATINYNSIFSREPPDMPNIGSVFERSTSLGREGEFDTSVPPADRPRPTRRRRGEIGARPEGAGWGRQARGEDDDEDGDEPREGD